MTTPSHIAAASGLFQQHLMQAFVAPQWNVAPPMLCDEPMRIESGGGNAGTLFVMLYHVARNDGLRNARLSPSADFGQVPALLDLHYLIAADAGQSRVAQALLEQVCVRLHAAPVLVAPDSDLVAPLTVVPVVRTFQELACIWQALQQRLRPSLAYCLTVPLDVSGGADAAPARENAPDQV